MAKKKSLLQRFLSSFGAKKTESTKKTEEELKKAGISKEDMPSDVEKMKKNRAKKTTLTGEKRVVPSATPDRTKRAIQIAEMLKKKKEQNKGK